MNRFLALTSLCLLVNTSQGQGSDSIFTDNNPRLTDAESRWINTKFKSENFDFTNKYIGFVELLSGGFYGVGKFTLPLNKKILAQLDIDQFQYKLIVLDTTEKRRTRGYDALLVLVNKKNKGKLERLKREKVVAEARNRYPQIPVDAGIDTNSTLNISNSLFFNEIYKADPYLNFTFDFIGKKVAIFDSPCQQCKIDRVSISKYVNRIKAQLNTYGFCSTDFTYYLTDEQKKESGGYDVIIQYRSKLGVSLGFLIQQLK